MSFEIGDVVYRAESENATLTDEIDDALYDAWNEVCDFRGYLTIYKGVVEGASAGLCVVLDWEELTFRHKTMDDLTPDYDKVRHFAFDEFELVGGSLETPNPKSTTKHKGLPVEVYNDSPIPDGEDLMAAVRDFCDGV